MSPADDTATPQRRAADLAPSFTPVPSVRQDPSDRPNPPARPRSEAPEASASEAAPQTRAIRSKEPASTAATTRSSRTPARATATIEDTTDDVDWTLRRPPDYTDIASATLTRTKGGFTLRVRFAAELPQRQHDDRTMNVASFFDTTGDGEIDYEIWANLADNGWGPSYRDRRNSEARFMADSGIRVAAKGRSLVFRFPLSYLAGARTFQWATASEWGSYETISTAAAARDHAPDTGAAPFPD
ncbi:hypothetical protein [Haloechinothrix salitolerans]|uniref:Uncharacterized protein n=1 Tax=Haloechinothrix salitolerans TaxID=926830 RepID=A0ABW2BSS0_9PSEU